MKMPTKMNAMTRLTILNIIIIMLISSAVEVSSESSPNAASNSIKKTKNRSRTRYKVRGVRWWSLAYTEEPSNELNPSQPGAVHEVYSKNLQILTRKQRKMVIKNPGSLTAVVRAAKLALEECKFQFKHRRWNCPTKKTGKGGSIFGRILQTGSRQTAFIHSVTSAAVVHAVARSCSEGSIYTCQCDYTHTRKSGQDWQWGGCSDNAPVGARFSQRFVDSAERGRDIRYMMNIHNNVAGRDHVISNMRQQCKCHGLSGSCTMKTCWMALAPFRDVGKHLKERFDGSSKVAGGNTGSVGGRGKNQRKFNFIPVNAKHQKPTRKDLVYFEDSPSFCDKGSSFGMTGTRGRECNATSFGVDGCTIMCCDRGSRSQTYIVKERCRCKFEWCCKVTCDVCTSMRIRHTCL